MTAPTWTGTPAEWDAERDRREKAITKAFREENETMRQWPGTKTLATATMPPRPVEPPSVTTTSGWRVTWDGKVFVATHEAAGRYSYYDEDDQCIGAVLAYHIRLTPDEVRRIVALRDGPAPRYVEDGWRVRYATGAHYNVFPDKDVATAIAAGIGGTAHAIYRRVEGDK